MQLKQRTHWIFDLDGTLTLPVHDFDHIRQELGIAPEQDILKVLAQLEGDEKRTMTERLDKLEHYYAALAKPADGVLALLDSLLGRGIDFGILTRNTKEIALKSLEAIGAHQYFHPDTILGRDEAEPKPNPQGINILINQWDAEAESTVMVGDFHFDLSAGKAAGVTTVHVDASDRHWPEITDYRVKSLDELRGLLN